MRPETAKKVLNALHGFARANWYQLAKDQELCKIYKQALKDKRFKYEADMRTCGRADCWTMLADLVQRYPVPQKMQADCEELACHYAAFLASQCYKGVEVGFVPGVKISHAICAVFDKGERRIIDPSRWYGMSETKYEGAIFRRLSEEPAEVYRGPYR